MVYLFNKKKIGNAKRRFEKLQKKEIKMPEKKGKKN